MATAHELWLEPEAYQVAADGRLVGDIVNGQNFDGITLAYIPQRIVNYAVFSGRAQAPIDMRAGDTPGLNAAPVAEGLNIVAYQSTVTTIEYATWDKFASFVAHKDLGITLEEHLAKGYPQDNFAEAYSRYSKTLIGVGHGAGSDKRTGLETEFVALTNPYTDDLSAGMQVQLFYQRFARPNAQVEVFDKAPDDTVTITLTRTDAQGIATIPVTPGHSYMLDAIVIRDPSPDLVAALGGVWETLWANLTFAVPAP